MRIDAKVRGGMMLRLLKSERKDDVFFAAKVLGEEVIPKAVYPLLDVLESESDKKIRLEIVRALERLRNPIALPSLTKIVAGETGELQEAAFRVAVNLLLQTGRTATLKYYARSESPRIRQIAYLAMLRMQGKKWEGVVAEAFRGEEDGELKVRVLSSVRTIETRGLFRRVFETALCDKALTVRMVAQSVLKRIRTRKVLGWLTQESLRGEPAVQELAVRLMADYFFSAPVSVMLEKTYRRTPSPRLKRIILHTLGEMKSRASIPFLIEIVGKDPVFGFSAASAFSKLANSGDWETIKNFMSESGFSYEGTVSCLSLIAHLPGRVAIPAAVSGDVRRLSEHPDRAIRYLAVRCLPKIPNARLIHKLLLTAALDPESGVRFAAVRSVTEVLQKEPLRLSDVASLCLSVKELFPVVKDIFGRIPVREEGNFKIILKSVLGLIQGAAASPLKGRLLTAMRFSGFLRNLAEGEKTIFLSCLRSREWDPAERLLLMRILNRTTLHEYQGVDAGFMAAQYPDAEDALKMQYLRFFAKMLRPGEAIQDLLCEALARENNAKIRDRIHRILASTLCRLQTAPSGG
jgi:HEAT repeat protein